jgi:glycosyltransferase involved in cell wall biosynthesis
LNTTDHRPLVSVLIPLYNSADYIRDTLDSILTQDYRNLEVIVVDDGSTDKSFEVVQDYIQNQKESRIQLHKNETNLGPEGNWNKTLQLAQGFYVKLVCSDDTLEPHAISKQVSIFENSQNLGLSLVTGTRVVINSKGERLGTRGSFPPGRHSSPLAIKKVIRSGTNPLGEPAAGMFKKSDAAKIGGYRIYSPYAIDVDFWIRLLQLGDLWFISEPVSTFRISKKSWSSKIGLRQSKDFRKFIQRTASENQGVIDSLDAFIGSSKSFFLGLMRVIYFRFFA